MNAQEQRLAEISDLGQVLMTEPGRRVFRRLLVQCNPFRKVMFDEKGRWDPDLAQYRAGRIDFGRWLMTELNLAHPQAFQAMYFETIAQGVEEEKKAKEMKADA